MRELREAEIKSGGGEAVLECGVGNGGGGGGW